MSRHDAGPGLPGEVRTFLERQVASFNELHVLLHVHRRADLWSTAASAAESTYLPDEWVAERLEAFAAAGLLDRRDAQPPLFRVHADHMAVLVDVGEALRTRRHRIGEVIHSPRRATSPDVADVLGARAEDAG